MNRLTIIDKTARQYVKSIEDDLVLIVGNTEYVINQDNLCLDVLNQIIENEFSFTVKTNREITVFNTRNVIGVGYYQE